MHIIDVSKMDDLEVMSRLVHGTAAPKDVLTFEEFQKFTKYFAMLPIRRRELLVKKMQEED